MKNVGVKNRLCALLALFFYISVQSTEITKSEPANRQLENEVFTDLDNNQVNQNNQQSILDLDLMRKQNSGKTQKNNGPGSFDTSFNNSGFVINTMGFNSAPKAVAVQQNNKIVVAGIRENYPVLVRYNENGLLDSDFGTGQYGPGVVIQTDLIRSSYFNAVAIQEFDQKIVAAGSTEGTSNLPGKCMLARYNSNGTLDQFFGVNGIVRTNIDGEFNTVAVQSDGKIVVAGYNKNRAADTQILLMRYDENGVLDDSFGTNGVVITRAGRLVLANAITIQKDHKIIVVGAMNAGNKHNIVITRYDENGALDKDFGFNKTGVIILKTERYSTIAYDVVVQEDKKIVIVGSNILSLNQSLFTIIRLHKNGSKDTSFGNNGVVTINPITDQTYNAHARSVALDENKNIIVMGYMIGTDNANYFSLARLKQNGTLDRTFGDHGIQINLLNNGTHTNVASIPVIGALQKDNKKLVLAGSFSASNTTATNQFAIARYHN